MRRRRRRSSFSSRQPQSPLIWVGLAAAVLVGALVFFMRQADVLAPAPHEIRVNLPDAFKE